MKGNFLLFASLLAGVLVGMSGATPHWLLNAQLPMILLELLIVQVGMGIGSMEHLDRLFAGFRWEMLLLPALHHRGHRFCSRPAPYSSSTAGR